MKNRKSILVTGASGFIGSSFVRKYCDVFDIYSVNKTRPSSIEGIRKEFLFDLSNNHEVSTLNGLEIDVIMHLSGQSSELKSFDDPLNDFQCNTQSTLNLLEFARKNKVKQFIYASSQALYRVDNHKESYTETDELIGASVYANSKIASENFIKCYNEHFKIPYTILRYFSIYGPGQDLGIGIMNAFIKQFADPTLSSIEIKGSLDRFRDFIYIDDVVDINKACILNENALNEVINVGTGTKTTLHDLLSLLKGKLDSEKDFFESESTKGNQFGLVADTTQLKKIYTRNFTDIDKGLNQYLDHLNVN